jgi:hypothetical protein
MIFIKIGKFAAHFIFWASLVQLALAFVIAFGAENMEANRAAAQRYLSANTTGEAIDEALRYVLIGLVLGIFAEIGARIVQIAEKLNAEQPKSN